MQPVASPGAARSPADRFPHGETQRPQSPLALRMPLHVRRAESDKVLFSQDAKSLNQLIRLWATLNGMFHIGNPNKRNPLQDLTEILNTIRHALQNLKEMQERDGVISMLKSSALQQAEALVQKYYGLLADGASLKIVLEPDMGNALASIRFVYNQQGRMEQLSMHLNMSQFTPDTKPNGVNGHIIENDRIIAHELTHAVMGRSLDTRELPDWFIEGTAEYIAGAAERVELALKHFTPRQLIARLARPWEGDTSQYAAAYLAIRYLDQSTGKNLKRIMAELREGSSLDNAIKQASGDRFSDTADFLHQFIDGGHGEKLLRSMEPSRRDAGSIKPGAGPTVVADTGRRSSQPLRGFHVSWPNPAAPPYRHTLS